MNQYCELGHCDHNNIYVKCGAGLGTNENGNNNNNDRRKRSLDKSSKLTIDFEVKVPYPENSTSNMSDTLKEVQSSVLQTMNKTAAVIEVNGEKLTLAEAPKLTFVSLKCAEGEVLSETSCGRCYIY